MVNGPSRLDGLERPSPFRESDGRVEGSGASRLEQAFAIPATPPPEVLDALDDSARVLEELASRGLSLHFEYEDAISRVRVQVTNEDGEVVREIPPSALLDIVAGAEAQNA